VLTKTISRYGRVDLSCINELGYMELGRHGAELLLQILTDREEKKAVAIASNEAFNGWTKTFTDPRLCAAIVDRLTYGGTIIEAGTDSHRLAATRPATSSQSPDRRVRNSTFPASPHSSPARPRGGSQPSAATLAADDRRDHRAADDARTLPR
jgi:hypothetical protein